MSVDVGDFLRAILFLPPAATATARSIDRLHFFVITTTMLGFLVVAVTSVYWLIKYRRKKEPEPTPHIEAPKWFETIWIGGLLGLFVLWWVIGFKQYIAVAVPPPDTENIYVVAKRWMWKFSHPTGRSSVGILVVPERRKVKLVLTSRDVIHSFYVPAFRVKQDVLPGRYTSVWFEAEEEGSFDVFCAEFCGTSHSRMWASVVVLDAADYRRWLSGDVPQAVADAGTRAALEGEFRAQVGEASERSMAERGEQAAAKHGCFSCHTIDGQPHIGPTWQRLYGKRVEFEDGGSVIVDEEYLTRSMMEPQASIVKGYRAVMPTYLGSLPQPDAAAIVEFIRSLRDSDSRPSVILPKTDLRAEVRLQGEAQTGGGEASSAAENSDGRLKDRATQQNDSAPRPSSEGGAP